MSEFFLRLDPPPVANEKFSAEFTNWISNLVDQMNETISEIQTANNNTKVEITADIGGGGAGPISVSVDDLTALSPIVATIASSTNTVSVAKCIGTATGFDITFTANPGASCIVNYIVGIESQ